MVLTSLGGLIGHAVEMGKASKNPVRDLRKGKKRKGDRQKRKLEVNPDAFGSLGHHSRCQGTLETIYYRGCVLWRKGFRTQRASLGRCRSEGQ
jgi:hypothetical protein